MDKRDEEERIPGMDIKPENMPAYLEEIKKRAEKYKGYKERMEQTGETQILETDPKCRSIRTKKGVLPAYNVQTVVDDESHMIVAFETTHTNTDQGLLDQMAEQTKQELNIEVAEFKADKGYESRADILKCVMHGSIPDVGFKYDKEQRFFDLEYREADITEETRSSTQPADIQKCLHASVLPDCYKGSTISVKLQRRSVISCFIRHEDGRVTCPIGRELFAKHTRKYGTVYSSREACRTCPNWCTDSQKAKEVQFAEKTIYVPAYMYGESRIPLRQIPDVQQDTPYSQS